MLFVYMIKNQTGKLYVGISKNVHSRLRMHNSSQGASYTKKGDFELVFIEKYKTFKEARKREVQIKKWRRDKKEMLIERHRKGLQTKLP